MIRELNISGVRMHSNVHWNAFRCVRNGSPFLHVSENSSVIEQLAAGNARLGSLGEVRSDQSCSRENRIKHLCSLLRPIDERSRAHYRKLVAGFG